MANMGSLRDRCPYPVRRTDDMISIAGRKIYAQEIERAVEVIPGVALMQAGSFEPLGTIRLAGR